MKEFIEHLECYIKKPSCENVTIYKPCTGAADFEKKAKKIFQDWWNVNKDKITLHGLYFLQLEDDHTRPFVRTYLVSENEGEFDNYFSRVASDKIRCEKTVLSDEKLRKLADDHISSFATIFCSYNGVPFIVTPVIKTLVLDNYCRYMFLDLSFLEKEKNIYKVTSALGLKNFCSMTSEFVH